MHAKPLYFETIRAGAARRWDQLEDDPELAGPWHQLFSQVQSPRHVVSELLQNADDAGATSASVDIVDDEFIFRHDGQDFTEEHLASLCRFGYSNKRTLHTIGFRGIGFKSTFSLGDEVVLRTPTLSISYNKTRFTEPKWVDYGDLPEQTEIRVKIENEHCIAELRKNFSEWTNSPTSLLFFLHLRSLTVEETDVSWESAGSGPIANSTWMCLSSAPEKKFLLIKSEPEDFPPDALEEIKEERRVTNSEEIDFPPATVELVLGLEGRLFVILPTGVKTDLPFACNAPFIQDPARVKIKNPEISPTNRWLLERVGKVASMAMLQWLNATDSNVEDRCDAYSIVPDVDREDNSIEGSCGSTVELSFETGISEKRFLLDDQGNLQLWKKCISVPEELLDIWTAKTLKKYFASGDKTVLSRYIKPSNRKKLIRWGCVEELEKDSVLDTLERKHLPKPQSWFQLLVLWAYVSDDVSYSYPDRKKIKILPVRGKNVLYASHEIIRFGEKRILKSNEDWKFLSRHLLVLNQTWTRYLAKKRRAAATNEDRILAGQIDEAFSVLSSLKMVEASDVNKIIQQVADATFSNEESGTVDYVRIAHIAAALNATVSDSFKYVTIDGTLKPISSVILHDTLGNLDEFVSESWYDSHVINSQYFGDYTSCTREEWEDWIKSARSKIHGFVPLVSRRDEYYNRGKFVDLLHARGLGYEPSFPYVTDTYLLDEWDFDKQHWDYWNEKSKTDSEFWGTLGIQILEQLPVYWSKALNAKASQESRNWVVKPVTSNTLLPRWIIILRNLPCLPDTRGRFCQPAELLRRTPETEPLMEVEPFIKAEYDTEALRPLLTRLGLRDTPTGSERLIERIRNLSESNSPPIYELGKWYHNLDKLVDRCDTTELYQIKETFRNEKLIYTDSYDWATSEDVYLSADENSVPNANVVHSSFHNLALWHRLDVRIRPTAETALSWLKGLESGQVLQKEDLRRVRSLLSLYPHKIWNECDHWLNLNNEWKPTEELHYSITMQSLFPWKNLFTHVKQKIADLQMLSGDVTNQSPFCDLESLIDQIEERFEDQLFVLEPPQNKLWLNFLGAELSRVSLDNEDETLRIRNLATRLTVTKWQVVPGLETVPFIRGVPVGTARRADVLWKEDTLFVEDRSSAKIAKEVARELGKLFRRAEIVDAIKMCYDRPSPFISDYIEENFKLDPITATRSNQAGDESLDLNQSDSEEEFVGTRSTDNDDANNQDFDVPEYEEVMDDDIPNNSGEPISEPRDEGSANKTRERVKIPLIERYALSRGFLKDSTGRFRHSNGHFIERGSNDNSYQWDQYDASGNQVKSFWTKEHCLYDEPLQLDAHVWNICEESPEDHSFILLDKERRPIEITGSRLLEMCDVGDLILYPAKYRLVIKKE